MFKLLKRLFCKHFGMHSLIKHKKVFYIVCDNCGYKEELRRKVMNWGFEDNSKNTEVEKEEFFHICQDFKAYCTPYSDYKIYKTSIGLLGYIDIKDKYFIYKDFAEKHLKLKGKE